MRAAARNDGVLAAGPTSIDGDTFGIGGQRIRIIGIDAPEIHPPRCLDEARLGLAAQGAARQRHGDDERLRPRPLGQRAAVRAGGRAGCQRGDDRGGTGAELCGREAWGLVQLKSLIAVRSKGIQAR